MIVERVQNAIPTGADLFSGLSKGDKSWTEYFLSLSVVAGAWSSLLFLVTTLFLWLPGNIGPIASLEEFLTTQSVVLPLLDSQVLVFPWLITVSIVLSILLTLTLNYNLITDSDGIIEYETFTILVLDLVALLLYEEIRLGANFSEYVTLAVATVAVLYGVGYSVSWIVDRFTGGR